METVLSWMVVLMGLPLVLGAALLLFNRRVGYAVGWALAQWLSEGSWRASVVCIALAFAALAVAVWSARLQMPYLFAFFLFVLLKLLIGMAGFTYTEEAAGVQGDQNMEWWRRSRL